MGTRFQPLRLGPGMRSIQSPSAASTPANGSATSRPARIMRSLVAMMHMRHSLMTRVTATILAARVTKARRVDVLGHLLLRQRLGVLRRLWPHAGGAGGLLVGAQALAA